MLTLLAGCSDLLRGIGIELEPEPVPEASEAAQRPPPKELSDSTAKFFVPLKERRMLPRPARVMNNLVQRELASYKKECKRTLVEAMRRREQHRVTMEAYFLDEGVPLELLDVGIIESDFRNDLKSPAGAAGIWQFMKSTARAYGLTVGLWRDERRDINRATSAVARHLRDLYARYQDWPLALGAYNAGIGGMDRAIKRTGSRDFWEIASRGVLRTETVRHVAKFYAVMWISDNPAGFGIADIPAMRPTLFALPRAE